MSELTAAEKTMFAKYGGRRDLIDDEDFWLEVLVLYGGGGGTNIPLPIEYNPLTVRRVLDAVDCPPGGCQDCCHYPRTSIRDIDHERLLAGLGNDCPPINMDGKGTWIDTSSGCPLAKDGKCSAYEYRPDICYLFPIQGGRDVVYNGRATQQMVIRAKCLPSVTAIRKFLTEAIEPTQMLLPNLEIVDLPADEPETEQIEEAEEKEKTDEA